MKNKILTLFSLALAVGAQAQVISTFPYTQNFEGEVQGPTVCTTPYVMLSPGWFNVTGTDNLDWSADQGGTPSAGTGPSVDKNPGTATGKYLYLESSGTCGSPSRVAHLLSPYFNFTSLPTPWVSYGCHLFGATQGSLAVDVTVGSTGVWLQVDVINGNQTDIWLERYVDLSAFTGIDSVRLRFRGTTGTSFTSDMAIDDVRVFDGPPCLPPTGVASSAVTANSATISWTGSGTLYNITWNTGAFTPPSANVSSTGATTFNLTGLSSNTTYNVYVQNDCGNGTSSWVGPISFTTLCGSNIVGDISTNPVIVNTPTYNTAGTTATCYTNNIGNLSNDIFYMVILDDCATSLDASLCGSSYDTYLRFYDLNLVELIGTDDDCGLQSEILDFPVTGGDTLFVLVEGFGSSNGAFVLNINQDLNPPTADVTYPSPAFYCQNGSNPTPTINGTPGGFFSEASGMAALNTTTGEIDVVNSAGGVYQVVYTAGIGTCLDYDTTTITIDPTDDASFNYPNGNNFCLGDATVMPTITGLAGGTFSTTSFGLAIDANTGSIDVSTLTVGNPYVVTYATSGVCPTSQTITLQYSDPAFQYAPTSACTDDADISPTITGMAGGMFSAGAGLAIDQNVGIIDLSASSAGTYTITYTINGCSATDEIVVNQSDNAAFTYGQNTFCANQNNPYPFPTILGTGGGAFSSTSGVPVSVVDGAILVDFATTGVNHTITYATNGICPDFATVNIYIYPADDAGFAYDSSLYCLPTSNDPTPTVTGLSGGIFGVLGGFGLALNTTTGEVNLGTSSEGTYTVTYTTNGQCPETDEFIIVLDSCTSTGIHNLNSNNGLQLFPNPNNGNFALSSLLALNAATLQIINALGQVIEQQNIVLQANTPHFIQTQQLASGTYFVRLLTDSQVVGTTKMTVTND